MSEETTEETTLLSAAEQLATLAAKYAIESDAGRALRPEVVDGLVAAGFARHFVPTAQGGIDGSFTELVDAVATVATGCASAAWVGAVLAGASRMGAYLPEQGQAELWADGADTVVAAALSPSGRAEWDGSGWRLRGEWPYTSGIDFSDWVLACAVAGDRKPWFFALPKASCRVEDTWFTVGMRATGSSTLIVDDVFIPEHRGFPRDRMLAGLSAGSMARCHTVALRLVSGLLFAAPALGAAEGALRAWTDWIATKREHNGQPARDQLAAQLVLARADGEISAARLLLTRAAEIADHGPRDRLAPARNARDACLAVELLVSSVDRIFAASGTRGQSATSPIQRAWRDVHCAATHVALRFDTAGAEYAKQALEFAG